MSTQPLHILILGAGPAGLTAALALHAHLPAPKPLIMLYEIKSSPSPLGGAVNLTPKALRYLHRLGVHDVLERRGWGVECRDVEMLDLYSGARYAELTFAGAEGEGIAGFFARRVLRRELVDAMLEVIAGTEGVKVVFGKAATRIVDEADGVRVEFADGTAARGDCLLGCDGIHSATRRLLVDAARTPTYTGLCVAMGISATPADAVLPWTTTALVSSRRGSLMCTYFEPTRRAQFVGAVMELADVGGGREAWEARGKDQEAIRRDLMERFAGKGVPAIERILQGAQDWTLYPVFVLPQGGQWTSEGGKVLLLGDAAHAMPPQGESLGICVEDAIVLSRAMVQHPNKPIGSIFRAYERVRRPQTDRAVKEATWRFETVKDKGWLMYQMIIRSTSWFLWWTAQKREAELSEDVSEMEIEIPE